MGYDWFVAHTLRMSGPIRVAWQAGDDGPGILTVEKHPTFTMSRHESSFQIGIMHLTKVDSKTVLFSRSRLHFTFCAWRSFWLD
jgi:hypothetical protein